MKKTSLTIIVPALNEEDHLVSAVRNAEQMAQRFFEDWEIIIFNDGSTDKTGAIATGLAEKDPRIQVVHHESPRNLGACYKEGVSLSTKDFVILIPGDNECGIDVMEKVFGLAGMADIISPYTANQASRSWFRRNLSLGFVQVINLLSGCRLKYYNGVVLHKTSIIRSCPIETDSFGYQAEALVKLINRGHTIREVGVNITPRPSGKSKALRIKNVIRTLHFLVTLPLLRLPQKAVAPKENQS